MIKQGTGGVGKGRATEIPGGGGEKKSHRNASLGGGEGR